MSKFIIIEKIYCISYVISFITFISCNNDVDIKNVAIKLGDDLLHIKNEELGEPYISQLYENFKYVQNNYNITKHVKFMAHKLETKIVETFSALESTRTKLEDAKYNMNLSSIPSTFIPCLQEAMDKNSETYKMIINGFFVDNTTFAEANLDVGYILQRMRRNMDKMKDAIKQQYFISGDDVNNVLYSPFSGCTGRDDTIIWNNYMSRNNYRRKNIVLLLDRGGSLSKRQFYIVQKFAKQLISTLNNNDRIALLTIASEWSTLANSTDCLLPNQIQAANNAVPTLKYAETSHKNTLYNFIDSLQRGNGATNHSLGMGKALEVVQNDHNKLVNQSVMVLYVSRGLLSSLTEGRTMLNMLAHFTNSIRLPITINTCAVKDESKPILYETDFLRDIAEQNYSKYNITYTRNVHRKSGFMLIINSTESIGFAVTRFFNNFNPTATFIKDRNISLPVWDAISNDLSITFSIGWQTRLNHFAMLAVDVYFSNIIEDITYYSSNQQYSYAFLIDLQGRVLMHPSFPRPSNLRQQLYYVDISHYEKNVRNHLLEKREGVHALENSTIKYVWNRVGDWYVVCVVLNTQNGPPSRLFKLPPSHNKLLYQHLDRTDEYKLCRHLNQLATLDAPSLYLSLSCFQSPFSASRNNQLKNYIAYLKDNTRLVANPGLKDDVRDEVIALAHVMEYLRKRHLTSFTSKYVVRRYVTSRSGVLQLYPGTILGPGFEPTKRPWFLQAIKHCDKLIFTAPYLDGGGAGYIVTAAYATSHIVVAVDFTYGYMFKLVLKHMPSCLDDEITCFLMDDHGYLIYHRNLMDNTNGAKPIEQQHIVHKETFVANDILNHKYFIAKLLCNNYVDSTIQRFYRLNTSYVGVLTNFVLGEHCVTYRIKNVPNTNLFIGIVNTTCPVVATFCPCSVVDRLCLNCNRMEQKECECPCECPLNIDTEVCRNTNRNISYNSPCMSYMEPVSVEPTFTGETDRPLDACSSNACQMEEDYLNCLGLTGCEWCKYDIDGTFLRKPFCSTINTCFNGVLGAISPYKGDLTDSILQVDTEYSPIGPILGSVIAMCIMLVLLFICYRSYTSPSSERLYLSSTHDNNLRMSDLNVNDNFHDLGNHRDKLLQEDRQDPVSPYCVASTYRRPQAPTDSDHGYSTMTPHDESEHFSLAPIETESLEDDLTSDNTSIHTSVSMKHNDSVVSPSLFTRLPNRNCIVVPVTVHRNMEMT